MISLYQYAGHWSGSEDWTPERQRNATLLLQAVNLMLIDYQAQTKTSAKINPATNSEVSGTQYGGFRPQSCPIGAPHSAHKEGLAVDVYDPHESLEDWLHDKALETYGLYREAPISTRGWVHLTTRAPASGHRTFNP